MPRASPACPRLSPHTPPEARSRPVSCGLPHVAWVCPLSGLAGASTGPGDAASCPAQFHAMDTLHRSVYDVAKAISALVPQGGPVLCRDEMEEWSASEASLFEEALEKYGKDFTDIQQDFVSTAGRAQDHAAPQASVFPSPRLSEAPAASPGPGPHQPSGPGCF